VRRRRRGRSEGSQMLALEVIEVIEVIGGQSDANSWYC
jgi:hypothetical protein